MDLLSIPNYYIKKGRPHGHRYGKKPGDHEYFIANSLKKKCKKKKNFLVSTTGSSATGKFRKSVALKNYVVKWTNWRTKTTRTTSLQKKLLCTATIGGSVQTQVGSDTMPVRHRADFKQALSTLRQLKHQEDTTHQQRWKSYSSSWWNWQESWWHSSYEHHQEDGPSTDRSGKTDGR